jgi:hypothetical protein
MPFARDFFHALLGDPAEGIAGTHAHVIGSSGVGKSKGIEYLIRHFLEYDEYGFAVIDWAGTLYNNLLTYLSYMNFDREIYLLNVADPEFVTPWNPFQYKGGDIGAFASQRIDLTVKPWGATGTNQTPTLENICRALYHAVVATGETLPNIAEMLDHGNKAVAHYVLRVLDKPEHRVAYRTFRELVDTNFRDWKGEVRSTINRLNRFLDSQMFQRVVGIHGEQLDIGEAMDRNAIILVNLGQTDNLYVDAARVFGAMLLNDFFNAAKKRNGTDQRYVLVLDEFQEYMTRDLASMLDGVRKGGLDLVLAHQHLGHLVEDPWLLKSFMTNARIKAIFGGLDYESAVWMVREALLDEANERWVKEECYVQEAAEPELMVIQTESESRGVSAAVTHGTSDTKSNSHSHSSSTSTAYGSSTGETASEGHVEYGAEEGDAATVTSGDQSTDSFSVSHTTSDSYANSEARTKSFSQAAGTSESATKGKTYMFKPKYAYRKVAPVEFSLDEKIHILAERLRRQPDRHLTLRIKNEPARREIVPFLPDYKTNDEIERTYQLRIYKSTNALRLEDADRHLVESRDRFIETAKAALHTKKKKPVEAPPQPPKF